MMVVLSVDSKVAMRVVVMVVQTVENWVVESGFSLVLV